MNLPQNKNPLIDLSSLRVLLADDNNYMRRILRMLLQGYGIRKVFEAEDGIHAMTLFNAQAPDIILIDWAMPSLNGLEVLQKIRDPDKSKNPYIPIIMLTSYSEQKHVTQARDNGATEFLCKPISAYSLYQRLVEVTANPRPFIKTENFFGPDRRRNANISYNGKEKRKKANNENNPNTTEQELNQIMD